MSKANPTSKYQVPNLNRALKILELLSQHPEGLTIAEITDMLKYPRNSVYRITATLCENKYIYRDEYSKIFRLTYKLLTLGHAAVGEQTLVDKAVIVMRRLRDKYKETVLLGILNGSCGVIIETVQGTHSYRFVLEPGKQFHLHTAAPGKAMIAFLPKEEQDAIVEKIEFVRFNNLTLISKKDFLQHLEVVKERGYAIDHAEETEGMHCLGAPIFNHDGYPIASVWLTGPSQRIKECDFESIGEEVKRHALDISLSLGYDKDAINNEFNLPTGNRLT